MCHQLFSYIFVFICKKLKDNTVLNQEYLWSWHIYLGPWIHKKKPYTYYKRKFWVYDKLRLEKYTFRNVNRYDMCVCNARIILISFSWPSAVIVQLLKCELSVHMSLIFRAWRDQDLMKRKIETKRVENLGGWPEESFKTPVRINHLKFDVEFVLLKILLYYFLFYFIFCRRFCQYDGHWLIQIC